MRLVFALTQNSPAMRVLTQEEPPNVLLSFAFASALRFLESAPAYQPEYFLLDSGAFSAWNCGQVIDIAEYAQWAQQISQQFGALGTRVYAVNLDVIPGAAGRTATSAELTAAMEQSLSNAEYLRERGLNVIEVFHQNEPGAYLNELLDRRPTPHSIVGISPRNDVNVNERVKWLRGVLGHFVGRYGQPTGIAETFPRTHGFAATGQDMLRAFPFYSADSSSWIACYRYGKRVDEYGRNRDTTDVLPSSRSQNGQNLMARRSIQALCCAQDQITKLWTNRGVVWSD